MRNSFRFLVHGLALATTFGAGLPALGATEFPSLATKVAQAEITKQVQTALKKSGLSPADQGAWTPRLVAYLSFLGVPKAATAEVLGRLMNSSTRFLQCEDLEDWGCLEGELEIKPKYAWRQDTQSGLGKPVDAGARLELESFFTARFTDGQRPARLAKTLADKIRTLGKRRVLGALYGIDDIQGSMKPVYDAIEASVKNGTDVRMVLDYSEDGGSNSFMRLYDADVKGGRVQLAPAKSIVFSYVAPPENRRDDWVFGRPAWMDELIALGENNKTAPDVDAPENFKHEIADARWFLNYRRLPSDSKLAAKLATRVAYQYEGNSELIRLLNAGIRREEDARARLEWPAAKIMHNKFLVLDSGDGPRSVWTGTTNIAKTCMGEESNANMAVLIRNEAVAEAFAQEFNEMYAFDPEVKTNFDDILVDGKGGRDFNVGRFHTQKRPNTARYFTFRDGTEARVHFSPTDDGEHRAILPLLLSARAGDHIRVAMFGDGGIEYVRAFQYAAAKGARVQILLDAMTGVLAGSWVNNPLAKIQGSNPYQSLVKGGAGGSIEVLRDDWSGMNHHKTATLTRKQRGKEIAEVLVVGSQNWSAGGNDDNDENMITVRNRKGLPAAEAFNQHFDTELWTAAKPLAK
ncbi:MAG: phosphatidylserine/phosphatidylglycerophosphate/cardiolipin synthase family protein [Bacteriovoracia bacterium]